jgi:hypothetical protein
MILGSRSTAVPYVASYPIYRRPANEHSLSQGDILDRDRLRAMLKGHQDWFADSSYYYRFMVLTQTCDLDSTREIVDFVFLAVVRKLDDAFGYEHVEHQRAVGRTEELLRALYNHNYNRRGFFYLPKSPDHGIKDESVVDLRVMFSIHRSHYKELLAARLGAITEVYSAQLGHIAGYLFSRVATPGWEEVVRPEHEIDRRQDEVAMEEAEDAARKDKVKAFKQHVQEVRKSILNREEKTFVELCEKARDACAVQGCSNPPATYRWLPVEGRLEQHVVCTDHARQAIREKLKLSRKGSAALGSATR